MGDAQARWMVDFMENLMKKWMIARGTPIVGNLHITRTVVLVPKPLS